MRLVALQYSLLLFVCLFPSSRRVYVRMSLLVSLLISLSASDLKRWPSARVLHSQFQHFIYISLSIYCASALKISLTFNGHFDYWYCAVAV